MPNNPSEHAQDIISSALALPADERIAVLAALHDSLSDPELNHGSHEGVESVQAAWKTEIQQRLNDIETGKVNTIPAELAEQMIRGDARPNV